MLKVRKGRPEPTAVPLGGGAVAFVRAATAFEVDLAIAGTTKITAGLIEGEEAAALATDLLGEEFAGADFTTRTWIEAAAQRVALLELSMLCTSRWEGIVDENDAPVAAPTKEIMALLLRDNDIAARFNAAIRAKVHEEIAEGNASAASLSGGAAAASSSAPTATRSEPTAH